MNLKNTFAVLKPDSSVDPVRVSPSLYEELDRNYNSFRSHALVSIHEFDSDWGMWERHPAGEEVVVLLSGSVQLTLRKDSADEVVELKEAGAYIIVPRNTWHTAHVTESARMLFITPGEGTENRAEI